jgi:hypothetical protein
LSLKTRLADDRAQYGAGIAVGAQVGLGHL